MRTIARTGFAGVWVILKTAFDLILEWPYLLMANARSGGGAGQDCLRQRRTASRTARTDFEKDWVVKAGVYVDVPLHTGAERIALSPVAGWHIYDTTLDQPLWHNGTNWIDGMGNVVP